MQYHERMKNKVWIFESNDPLDPSLNEGSNPLTPIEFHHSEVPNARDLEQLQAFNLATSKQPVKKGNSLASDSSKIRSKTIYISEEQASKRTKQREQPRKSKGLTSKTKTKLHQQIRTSQQLLEEKQEELQKVSNQLEAIQQQCALRKKQKQDIANNEQMLKFKEDQLNNLKNIHQEIIQTTKNDILREKAIKKEKEEVLARKIKEVEDYRNKIGKKNQMKHYIDQLTNEKKRLEQCLNELSKIQEEKIAVRSEAIQSIVQELIQKNKKEIEKECLEALKVIRSTSTTATNFSLLKKLLEAKGVKPTSYYTYSQLRYVPEFNFRLNKEAEQIMNLLDRSVDPQFVYFQEEGESTELKELNKQLLGLQDVKKLTDAEIRSKQEQIQQLRKAKDQLLGSQNEMGSKKQSK